MEEIVEESLKFSQSPLCPLAADVISDGFSIYFYMYNMDYEQQQLFARSACWVKNLKPAPDEFDTTAIEQGKQPMLPNSYISDAMDTTLWSSDDLKIVWSKEGHIAALLYQDEVLSILPSWADGKNFPGYSLYAIHNNMVAYSLQDALEVMLPRIKEGQMFWEQEFNLVWKEYNTPYLEQLKKSFGDVLNIYDLHADQFPSRLLATFEKGDYLYAFTIGVGMFSMPNADRYYDDYETRDRSEFAICLAKQQYSTQEQMDVFKSISSLCSLPWQQIDCLHDMHTLEMPLKDTTYCILLDDDRFVDKLDLTCKKEGVHLHWIQALSDEDYDTIKEDKERDTIVQRLVEKGHAQ